MKRLRYLLGFACILLWSGRAEAVTVAVLRPASDAPALDEALFRLKGELLAVGLTVTILDRPPFGDTDSAPARAWFEHTAAARAIDAFIDVAGDDAPSAADIWICERSPPRLRLARVVLPPDAENPAATLAIRAIDVLRSSFLALDWAGSEKPPPEPRRAVARPATDREPASAPRDRAGRLGLEAGAALLTSLDGVGPAVLPLVGLDWSLGSSVALQGTAAGFGTHPSIGTESGSVEVAQQFGLLGICLCAPVELGLRPLFALATGVLATQLDGRAAPPNVAHRETRLTALFDGSAGARLGLGDGFSLTFAAHLQVAEPYVAVHIVDAVVATSGRPNLLLTLSAGVRP